MRRSAVVSGKTKIYPVIAAADWQALEAAVRNGIEAGAHDFFLFKSNRSNIPESALVKRFPRLEQIIESAASQSRRRYLPTVRAIGREVLLRRPGRHIVLHPATGLPLEELLRPTGDLPEDLYLWIGPEGGFDDEEIDSFVHHGAQCALLNTPILRLENAVTLAVGMARHLRGDQTTETMLPG